MAYPLRCLAIGLLVLGLQFAYADAFAARRGKAQNFHGISAIKQVPPHLRARGRHLARNGDGLYPLSAYDSQPWRQGRRRPVDLVEALIEPPSPATRDLLFELGIPAIEGVPPAAVLWGLDRHPRDGFSARRRLRR